MPVFFRVSNDLHIRKSTAGICFPNGWGLSFFLTAQYLENWESPYGPGAQLVPFIRKTHQHGVCSIDQHHLLAAWLHTHTFLFTHSLSSYSFLISHSSLCPIPTLLLDSLILTLPLNSLDSFHFFPLVTTYYIPSELTSFVRALHGFPVMSPGGHWIVFENTQVSGF